MHVFCVVSLDAIQQFCPNIPYYGGFIAVAGERARACLLDNQVDEVEEVIEEGKNYLCYL